MADNIQVAVRVRPLSENEKGRGCVHILRKVTGEPQITVNSVNNFTFNHVFMPDSEQGVVYESAIVDILDKLFQGYNCTILAYGQTGSGKTYTMGTNYSGLESTNVGIIPRAIHDIFARIEKSENISAKVTCSFMELYQEELYDLLAPGRRSLDIREVNNNVCVPGLTEIAVLTPEETGNCLIQGSERRATGSTAMNEHSSRSHAIFTLHLKIVDNANKGSSVTSKFHLVDLAGSERVSKTKATGERFREGVKINQGLLCLGNVISALGTGQKTASFRESKLTRLLQSSLGGNSVTLMIACVSPADYNLDETMSTLRYADRAKQIKNKAVVNTDPHSEEIARLHDIILKLRNQLATSGYNHADDNGEALPNPQHVKSFLKNNVNIQELSRMNSKYISDVAQLQLQLHNQDEVRESSLELIEKVLSRLNALNKSIEDRLPVEELVEICIGIIKMADEIKAKLNFHQNNVDADWMPDSNHCDDEESQDSILTINMEFTSHMKKLQTELAMKQDLEKMLMKNLVSEEVSNDLIKDFAMKIKLLEKEKHDLQQKLTSTNKADVTAKLSEDRRRKVGALEKEIEGMRKKIMHQEKMIMMSQKTKTSLMGLQNEIKELKQEKVKLVKNVRKEQDKFRQEKLRCDKQINVLREKDLKRMNEIKKLEIQHQNHKRYLERKVSEANIKAAKAETLLKKQQDRKAAIKGKSSKDQILKDPEQIEARLAQELELIHYICDVEASLGHLMEARKELAKQLESLDPDQEDYSVTKAMLESEIQERNLSINDLQQKIQAYDLVANVEGLAKELQSDEAVKILVTQFSDLRREHYEYELLKESKKHLLQDRVDQLESELNNCKLKLLHERRQYEEKISILLQNEGDNEEKLRPIIKDLLNQIEALKEENEGSRLLKAAKNGVRKPVNKHLQQVQMDEIMSSDSEAYDTDGDPDWSMSQLTGRRRSSKDKTQNNSKNQSAVVVSCSCKTDCSKRLCKCRKNNNYCGSHCACINCVNKTDEEKEY